MNRSTSALLFVLIAILFSSCQRQNNHTKSAFPTPNTVTVPGPPGYHSPVMNKPYPGTGVVATINRSEGWIEINHEEIKGLMPAMQMEFNVKDKTLLDKVNVGDRVDFTIVETEKGEYLTELKRLSAP